ncbi:hypothetical protein HanRHA438_Chr13g0596891 [Helianthus annuus]|uniref:Uncharacterized protein n=1 Tax=Helianthus annuus TaxID=4232 RepID=A0A251SR67_HELAN|nr:hypothetical protein HanXRQr2_Chr13g0586201 [Helianthus annuus]KAJ0497553.1 hypothetical protein HanHA89_Chr13g0512621 [Helianthus annuus]KAJ0671059.1 hypothetical protein HanOQP8_Chr13g0481461 [Helianthus annuus]KAJ0858048.1 hypothetical protein HanRHA438_Chr13g0596891 [Helianthus annuus]
MGRHGIRILTQIYIVSKIFFSFKNDRTLFSLSPSQNPSAASSSYVSFSLKPKSLTSLNRRYHHKLGLSSYFWWWRQPT